MCRNLVLIPVILIVCILAGSVAATETRLLSMGDLRGLVADDADVALYPQTVVLHDGLFSVESEADAITDMGAAWGLGAGSLGLRFSTTGRDLVFPLTDERSTMDQRLNVVYGRTVGGVPVGLEVGWYGSTGENVPSQDFGVLSEWTLRRLELLAGATLVGGRLDVAVGIASTDWDDRLWSGSAEEYLDSTVPLDVGERLVRLRWWGDTNGPWRLVPHASWMRTVEDVDFSPQDDGFSNVMEFAGTVWEAGVAVHYSVADDVMTVTDVGIRMDEASVVSRHGIDGGVSDDVTSVDDAVVLPYVKVGLDARLRDWLDLRCGVHARWETREQWYEYSLDPDPPVVARTGRGVTDMYLGFGVHWGAFILDGAMENAAFLHNGPHFISGSATDDLAGRLSLTYAFD